MRFRKKPVEIDAVKATSLIAAVKAVKVSDLPEWCVAAFHDGTLQPFYNPDRTISGFKVMTKEGQALMLDSDAVLIRGVEGELYPCARSIFEKTYERVE